MAIDYLTCSKHPKYQGLRPPRADCETMTREEYDREHGLEAGPYEQ